MDPGYRRGSSGHGIQRGSSPLELDPVLLGISLAITTLAGATSLAIRVNASLLADPTSRWCGRGCSVSPHARSWLAGCLGFIMGRAQAWDVWTSFWWSWWHPSWAQSFVEMMAEKYLSVIRPKQVILNDRQPPLRLPVVPGCGRAQCH